MRVFRLPAALAAAAAALALLPVPTSAQDPGPRFVVFEAFLRPT